tara:strand:- start:409 stop:708 length:300 start_codon:yes stop_codon:yes gene_type:complete
MKNFWLLFSFIFIFTSCGDVGKVLRNEKIRTTDEFLVKKKGPLVLPPDYEKVPSPDTIRKQEDDEKNKIKKILKGSNNNNKSKSNNQSLEKSILEKIRK